MHNMLLKILSLGAGLLILDVTNAIADHQFAPPETQQPTREKIVPKTDTFMAFHHEELVFQMETLKWRDGHRGAISITYDAPWGIHPVFSLATDAAMSFNVHMDIEVVSEKLSYVSRFPIVARMREELIPNGIHLFGHGHSHVRHDHLNYNESYYSFKLNFDLMQEWGLNPKVYAYPHSSGELPHTQLANKNAGFIAARGGTRDPALYNICPGAVREPELWHYLPSVVMGTETPEDIPDHATLRPILENTLDAGAWVILMYHSIGFPEGWAYYPFNEFVKDVRYIDRQDFWSGNMDSVVLYIKERNAVNVEIFSPSIFGVNVVPFQPHKQPRIFYLSIRDNLDNVIYNEPLTFEFTFNPSLNIRRVFIDPALDNQHSFDVVDNKIRANIIPNEKLYTLVLED